MNSFFKVLIFASTYLLCGNHPKFHQLARLPNDKIKGMSIVSPPRPPADLEGSLKELNDLGVNYIALHPFGFFKKNEATVYYYADKQWWGETPNGIIELTKKGRDAGFEIFLKPQLWSHNQWIGELSFSSDSLRMEWEKSYRAFILPMAKLADSLEIKLFCIGTEIDLLAIQNAEYWRQLIRDIRKIYKGELTYAANWDAFEKIEFWDDLDYIGIDAYFCLDESKTPSIARLKKAWKKPFNAIKALQQKYNKPVLFTEFGYMSINGCASSTWELEPIRHQLPTNEKGQANALTALLEVFGQEEWWQGGFQWKWYLYDDANYRDVEPSKDYTPKGKEAANVLRSYYK